MWPLLALDRSLYVCKGAGQSKPILGGFMLYPLNMHFPTYTMSLFPIVYLVSFPNSPIHPALPPEKKGGLVIYSGAPLMQTQWDHRCVSRI